MLGVVVRVCVELDARCFRTPRRHGRLHGAEAQAGLANLGAAVSAAVANPLGERGLERREAAGVEARRPLLAVSLDRREEVRHQSPRHRGDPPNLAEDVGRDFFPGAHFLKEFKYDDDSEQGQTF